MDWTALQTTTDAKGERFVHRAVTPSAHRRPPAGRAGRRPGRDADPQTDALGRPCLWLRRPLHWLVALFGDRWSRSRRWASAPAAPAAGTASCIGGDVPITAPSAYVDALRAAHVLVDPDERRARVIAEVEAAARAAGGSARIDEDNLQQVNCLNEWPVAVACAFEREFLAVPQEALVATMETNQKFFPVLDAGGRLTEHFIGIANIASRGPVGDPQGLRARDPPALRRRQFFFDEDLKQGSPRWATA